MKLKEYLKIQKIKGQDFASLLGVNKNHIYQICADQRKPGMALIRLIEMETKGAVTRADYISNSPIKMEKNKDQLDLFEMGG